MCSTPLKMSTWMNCRTLPRGTEHASRLRLTEIRMMTTHRARDADVHCQQPVLHLVGGGSRQHEALGSMQRLVGWDDNRTLTICDLRRHRSGRVSTRSDRSCHALRTRVHVSRCSVNCCREGEAEATNCRCNSAGHRKRLHGLGHRSEQPRNGLASTSSLAKTQSSGALRGDKHFSNVRKCCRATYATQSESGVIGCASRPVDYPGQECMVVACKAGTVRLGLLQRRTLRDNRQLTGCTQRKQSRGACDDTVLRAACACESCELESAR